MLHHDAGPQNIRSFKTRRAVVQARTFTEILLIRHDLKWLLHFCSNSPLIAWESRLGWPTVVGECTYMGDQEEASLLGSVPAVVTTWGMNHQMEDHFLCLSFCFHKICISNKNKCFLKRVAFREECGNSRCHGMEGVSSLDLDVWIL